MNLRNRLAKASTDRSPNQFCTRVLQEGASCIVAFAHIRSDFVYTALSSLDKCQQLQREYWALLSGGSSNVGHLCYFVVEDIVVVSPPVKLPTLQGARSYFTTLPVDFMCSLIDQLHEESLCVLPDWLVQMSAPLAVRIPSPFAGLLAARATKSFAVCELCAVARREPLRRRSLGWSMGWGRHHHTWPQLVHLRDSFPRPSYGKPPADALAEGGSMMSGNLIAETLGQARDVISAHPSVDTSLERARLHEKFSLLQDELDYLSAFKRSRHLYSGQGFEATTLIHAFLLCDVLKQDESLKQVCINAARLLLPRPMAEVVAGWVEEPDGITLPSKSVISRLRGRMDVCFMVVLRRRLGEMMSSGGVVVYPGIDSSPQAGRDYQMVVLDIVQRSKLAELQRYAAMLDARTVAIGHRAG